MMPRVANSAHCSNPHKFINTMERSSRTIFWEQLSLAPDLSVRASDDVIITCVIRERTFRDAC